jgi:homoserine dehydrogenase
VGATLYYGAGAGSNPTASAVVSDLLDVVRTLTVDPENRVPHLAFQPNAISALPILSLAEIETAYYLRLRAIDEPGVLAKVATILSQGGISIEAIYQHEPKTGQKDVDIVLLTHKVKEKQLDKALNALEALPDVVGDVTRIRLETLDA